MDNSFLTPQTTGALFPMAGPGTSAQCVDFGMVEVELPFLSFGIVECAEFPAGITQDSQAGCCSLAVSHYSPVWIKTGGKQGIRGCKTGICKIINLLLSRRKKPRELSEYHMINSTFLKLSKMYLQGFGALQPPHCVLNFGQASKSLGTGSHQWQGEGEATAMTFTQPWPLPKPAKGWGTAESGALSLYLTLPVPQE